jgi:D-alanyl-D-alanine carboxypeptidase
MRHFFILFVFLFSRKEDEDQFIGYWYVDRNDIENNKMHISKSATSKVQQTIDTEDKDYLVGKTNFSSDKGFVIVDSKNSSKNIYLRTQVYEAFIKMSNAAKKDGIDLIIISGARSFDHQKRIWERKWKNLSNNLTDREKALKILQFSSMPMSSRHHWGTDFDLNSLENEYFEIGEGLKIYKWLVNNASEFGFCQVYSDKKINNRNGYEMEKWHWSYIPLASQVLERYNKNISIKDFNGFIGSDVASDVKIIENYVNGITTCK